MVKTSMLSIFILQTIIMAASGPVAGYVDHWGNDVPGLITNDTWMNPMPTYAKGKMVFYGPYAMDATAEFRGINYDEMGCIGGVALMSPYNILDKVWINVFGDWYGPFCVVDCAKRGDMYSIVVYREEVIEVNFEFALEIGMVSDHRGGEYDVYNWFLPVEILVNYDPFTYFLEYGNNVQPVIYKEYFLQHLEFSNVVPRWIMVLEEGKIWKEYASEVYWEKP